MACCVSAISTTSRYPDRAIDALTMHRDHRCRELLGLEAARGLLVRGVNTVLIEHEPHLMPRQLDRAGGGTCTMR